MAAGLLLLLHTVLPGETNEDGLTAGQLIGKAHQHDNMWASDEDASRRKALEHYSAALLAEPDDAQRLHVLYRMAQLYGSAYQLEKGEKPDFRRAIELNRRIVDAYPPTEPLVAKALISLGDHHVTLRQFEKGLTYFQRVLEYDTRELEQLRDDAENEDDIRRIEATIARIKQFQEIAVDQVGYCAALVHPLCARASLQTIAATHRQSFLREYAARKMASGVDPYSELWAPALSMGEEALSAVPAQQPVDSANENTKPASPPKPLALHAPPLRSKSSLYIVVGVSIIAILSVAGMVITRKRNYTFTGKDTS